MEREIRCGEEQLTLANQLLADCSAARNKEKEKKPTTKAKKLSGSSTGSVGARGRKARGFMTTRR